MNTNLSSSAPAELETDCLVAVVLDHGEKDHGEKDKPAPEVASSDAALRQAAQEVIASGEVTGKAFETTLVHHPANLKAKRLLLLGGGKSKSPRHPRDRARRCSCHAGSIDRHRRHRRSGPCH